MTNPAAPSHGAGTSPMRSTAPRRRAPTDERRCRFPWRQQQRHLGGVSQAEPRVRHNQRAVMGLMGWSNNTMTTRYQHLTPDLRRDIAEQVDGLLWESR